MSLENFYCIKNAKVIWANYKAIRSEQIRQTGFMEYRTKNNINKMLLDYLAVLSEPHTKSNCVHSAPYLTGVVHKYFRPPGYGRASIAMVNDYIFDLKGTGVRFDLRPESNKYLNGLFQFQNAVYEAYCEILISKILYNERNISTQKSLAIILLPISLTKIKNTKYKSYACVIVRSPSVRLNLSYLNHEIKLPNSKFISKEKIVRLKIYLETQLRKYGLTSCNPFEQIDFFRDKDVFSGKIGGNDIHPKLLNIYEKMLGSQLELPCCLDVTNIQISFDTFDDVFTLVDFEHINFRDCFTAHFCVTVETSKGVEVEVVPTCSDSFVRKVEIEDSRAEILNYRPYRNDSGIDTAPIISTPLHQYVLQNQDFVLIKSQLNDILNFASGNNNSGNKLRRFSNLF